MPNGDIVTNVVDPYLKQFSRPIGVSAMSKLQQFPMLQKLGYNGQLGSLKEDFHGLKDFNLQLDAYSKTSLLLGIAWNVIKNIAPTNPSIATLLTTTPGLGTVGKEFSSIHNFAQVFALSPADLQSPTSIKNKADLYVSQSSQDNTVNV